MFGLFSIPVIPFVYKAAALAVAVAVAFGSTYATGYSHGRNNAEVKQLRADLAYVQLELRLREQAEVHAARLAEEQAAAEQHNEQIGEGIENAIAASPPIDGCMPSAFLDGLRKLQ